MRTATLFALALTAAPVETLALLSVAALVALSLAVAEPRERRRTT